MHILGKDFTVTCYRCSVMLTDIIIPVIDMDYYDIHNNHICRTCARSTYKLSFFFLSLFAVRPAATGVTA